MLARLDRLFRSITSGLRTAREFARSLRDERRRQGVEDTVDDVGGYVECEIIRNTPSGPRVMTRAFGKNLIVNIGKKQLWQKAIGTNTKLFKFFRLGSSSAGVVSSDTNVVSPIASSVKTAHTVGVDAGRTYKWIVSYPSGAGSLSAANIKECVLGDQSTNAGSILMRALISPVVTKTTADKLKLTYKARIT